MKTYKRIVALTFGLCATLLSGAVNALFMTPRSDWFENLVMPSISPVAHSFVWLAVYFLTAVVFGEFLIEKPLRRHIPCVILLLLGNAVWCAVFFRLHSAVGAFIVICVILADLIYTLAVTLKHTKNACFLVAIIMCRYIYLAGLNLLIIIFN